LGAVFGIRARGDLRILQDDVSEPVGNAYSVPLVIAVTGHRDLVAGEVPGLRDRVRQLFRVLRDDYPDGCVQVVSGLAAGADQLVAEVALEEDLPLVAVLPMPKILYESDFETKEARAQLNELYERATERIELPPAAGSTLDGIAEPSEQRARQYAQLGVFLSAHCHVLLAIWDGKASDELGGTSQVVRFHRDDVMPGYAPAIAANRQLLVDDEGDLVYHLVCSRDRPDGAPADGLEPLTGAWFTKDRDRPRSQEMPLQHRLVFERSAEFNRDARRHAGEIEASSTPLYAPQRAADLPPGVGAIDRLFRVADRLAVRFQRRVLLTLRAVHVLAFCMGLMFILYTDVRGLSYYMFAFLTFFLVAAVIQRRANRQGWHRKYLDYRALAEGLRVQFFWAVAGVGNDNASKFTHDSFLQTQDPEVGWIRNIMRVAGLHSDASLSTSDAGLAFVLREWIGDPTGQGQLGYFAAKLKDKADRNRVTDALGRLSLLTSVAVVAIFAVLGARLPSDWSNPLKVAMGTTLLIYGIRQGYGYATAEKDLIKQYEFMLRLFQSARRRLGVTSNPEGQRRILKALGDAALDEHADWILMHRERAIDQSQVWRMGS
jgi:hypothetical protein